jgi:hypothetical protein
VIRCTQSVRPISVAPVAIIRDRLGASRTYAGLCGDRARKSGRDCYAPEGSNQS